MSIQGSINSMIGSASHMIMAVKGLQSLKAKSPQAKAQEMAKQSLNNEVEAKRSQKDLISQFKDMSKEDRTAFLRESQHYQAQQKRGGK